MPRTSAHVGLCTSSFLASSSSSSCFASSAAVTENTLPRLRTRLLPCDEKAAEPYQRESHRQTASPQQRGETRKILPIGATRRIGLTHPRCKMEKNNSYTACCDSILYSHVLTVRFRAQFAFLHGQASLAASHAAALGVASRARARGRETAKLWTGGQRANGPAREFPRI